MSCDGGSAPAGLSPCSGEGDRRRKTQRGSTGVQREEGEAGANKKRWYLKATAL